MVRDIVKNNNIPIIIEVIKLDNVIKPNNFATHSIIKGKTARINIIKDEKYHNNYYLIGILPLLTTTVVAKAKTIEKTSKSILKETDIIYTSLF